MEIVGQAEQEKRLLSIMVQGVGENGENGWETMTGCTSGFALEIIEVDSELIGDADLREVEASWAHILFLVFGGTPDPLSDRHYDGKLRECQLIMTSNVLGQQLRLGMAQGNKNTCNTGAFRLCMRSTVVCVDSSHRINWKEARARSMCHRHFICIKVENINKGTFPPSLRQKFPNYHIFLHLLGL